MKIGSQKDFASGLMFSALGIAFTWGASTYNIGSGARMGPGYFPLVLGIILTLLGACIAFNAVRTQVDGGDKIGAVAWKPLGFIIGANIAFGALLVGLPAIKLPAMGLIVGIYALVFIASMAGDRIKWREVLVLATILAVGSYLAFVKLLNLQFPVWPAFISA